MAGTISPPPIIVTAAPICLNRSADRPTVRYFKPVSCAASVISLSGPEGGFTAGEEDLAVLRGFTGVCLGTRVLRADTAPLAVMAALSLHR